jgi:hypothetical protein
VRGTGHDPNGTNGTNGTNGPDCGEDANEEGPSASAFGDKVRVLRLSLRSSVHPSVYVFSVCVFLCDFLCQLFIYLRLL